MSSITLEESQDRSEANKPQLTVKELVKALHLCAEKTKNGETCITGQKDCPFGVTVMDCTERMNLAAADSLESIAAERDAYRDKLKAALAENTRLTEKVPHWISVKDRLPEEDGNYLAVMDGDLCGQEEPFTSMCGIEKGKWDEPNMVLYWMPLPEPPKEEVGVPKRKFIKCCDCKYFESLKCECHNSKLVKAFPNETNSSGYRSVENGDSCNQGEHRLYKDHDCAGCIHNDEESEACYECKRISCDNYCCELKEEASE